MTIPNGYVSTREFEARHTELVLRLQALENKIDDVKSEQGNTWKGVVYTLVSVLSGFAIVYFSHILPH
jgi:hypothetical protein